MKKTLLSLLISALVVAALVVWALNADFLDDPTEILMISGVLILVGFALSLAVSRIRSHLRREPAEDERSRRVMSRTASLSYYISLYLWLLIMILSDRITLPVHNLIGLGIMGMALIFFFSWIWVKTRGSGDA